MYCLKCGIKTMGVECDVCGFNLRTSSINGLADISYSDSLALSEQSGRRKEIIKQHMYFEHENREEIRRRAIEILGIK